MDKKGFLDRAAQTQTLDVRGQLEHGIRFFDARFKFKCRWSKKIVPFHGVVKGDINIEEILQQYLDFVKAHPSEKIFLKLEQVSPKVLNYLMDFKIVDGNKVPNSPAMQEILKLAYQNNGQNLSETRMSDLSKSNFILIGPYNYENSYFFPRSRIFGKFNKKTRMQKNVSSLVNGELNTLNEADGRLNYIAPINTPHFYGTLKWEKWWHVFTKSFRSLAELRPLENERKISNERNEHLLSSEEFIKRANGVSLDDVGSEENQAFFEKLINLNATRDLTKKLENVREHAQTVGGGLSNSRNFAREQNLTKEKHK
jgi:hypothetical protein